MGLFGKPTVAQIYVSQLRKRLDATLVPLFAPDTQVVVGSVGSFDRGQFVPAGYTLADAFGVALQAREDATPSDWVFASEGAVQLVPEGSISIGGVDLLKGKLSFSSDRAVVASFKGVTESAAVWTPDVNRQVWELYLGERLPPDAVVVRAVRRAASGTVVVTRKSGVTVELAADPALLGGLLSLQGLGAGVTFTGGTQTAFQLSGPGLTPFLRVKGTGGNAAGALSDVYGFDGDPADSLAEIASLDVPDLGVESALGQADWDEPED